MLGVLAARGDDVDGSGDDRDAPPQLRAPADERAAGEESGGRGTLPGWLRSPCPGPGPERRGYESRPCSGRSRAGLAESQPLSARRPCARPRARRRTERTMGDELDGEVR